MQASSPDTSGPVVDLRGVGATAATEVVAAVRSALCPLGRLAALPPAPRGRTPVVLVHGYLGHPDTFRPLVKRLYAAGRGPVRVVAYPSTRLSLEGIMERVAHAVVPLASLGPVDLVGHSLGAVACRAWLKAGGGADYVRRFVSLGGPHAGTALWPFTPPSLWPALRPGGDWPRRLAEGDEPVPTFVIRARYDHQVQPPRSAHLPGVHELVLDDVGHNGLLWSPRVHEAVLRILDAAEARGPEAAEGQEAPLEGPSADE